MNEAGNSAGSLGNMSKLASREKYWEECADAEKIERLRQELARACRLVERQNSLLNTLMAHEHSDGSIVVPLHGRSGSSEDSGGAFTADRGIPFSLRTERERR